MTLGARGGCVLGLGLFVVLFMAGPAVVVHGLGMVLPGQLVLFLLFNFLVLPFLFQFFGDFAGLFMAFDAFLNIITHFEIVERLVVGVVMALTATCLLYTSDAADDAMNV